ncbi:MAG TPA: hypothetical protein VJ378_02030, partial [Candidatus Paceibacterota bacterium]|nr:hypothetical protein [Candidatus Paceibacterota bacterium]
MEEEKFHSLGKGSKRRGKEEAKERMSDEEEAMETMGQRNASPGKKEEAPSIEEVNKPTPIAKIEKSNDISIDKQKSKSEKEKALANFDPKEVTTKYWIDGIVELPNEQKIDYLNNVAIKRLHEIMSSKDISNRFKKRAEAKVESLQKTIKNIEDMAGEENLVWARKQVDKINNWHVESWVKDKRLVEILLRNNMPQENIDKMSAMEAWRKFEE